MLVARTSEKARAAQQQVASFVLRQRSRLRNHLVSSESSPSPSPTSLLDLRHNDDTDQYHRHQQQLQPRILALACDQCSLESVREFCRTLREILSESYRSDLWSFPGIDVLCLNAAVLVRDDGPRPTLTKDGLETTFQTNHVAPFLMVNLLSDLLNPATGRVVFTTSGLHLQFSSLDFSGVVCTKESGGSDSVAGVDVAPLSSLESASDDRHRRDIPAVVPTASWTRQGFDMPDGSQEFHYKRAYSLSKLYNVAVCRELHELYNCRIHTSGREGTKSCYLASEKGELGCSNESSSQTSPRKRRAAGVVVNCFSPGLMLQSGLFRHQDTGDVQRQHRANPKCVRQAKTVEWGGGALAYMAVSDAAGQVSGMYWSDESYQGCAALYGIEFKPSPLTPAVEDTLQRRTLWEVSAQLAHLQPDEDLTDS